MNTQSFGGRHCAAFSVGIVAVLIGIIFVYHEESLCNRADRFGSFLGRSALGAQL
jgi:hypothetical protein